MVLQGDKVKSQSKYSYHAALRIMVHNRGHEDKGIPEYKSFALSEKLCIYTL